MSGIRRQRVDPGMGVSVSVGVGSASALTLALTFALSEPPGPYIRSSRRAVSATRSISEVVSTRIWCSSMVSTPKR